MIWQRVRSWLSMGGLFRGEGIQEGQPRNYGSEVPATVNFDTAMTLSAVWAASRLITESIAALPLKFYRVTGSNKQELTDGILPELFSGKVNRYQTRQEFLETFILNLVMTGNAYALKQFSGTRLVGLLPLMTSQVETRLMPDGEVVHYYYHDSGVTALSADSVWHAKLFGNGIVGLSPLAYAKVSVGVALAGESRVATIFKNGGKPTGVLMYDKTLTKDQREHIRQEFNELREGNGDRLMVLEAGFKYEQISMSPQDIQLLESRRYQIEDIARFWGVPSVLINDTSGSTTWGSGIHELVQGFYKLNLRPYLERLEASIVHNLAPTGNRVMAEFDFDALLRADRAARMDAHNKAINGAVMTSNEARAAENLPPLPGGDQLLVNGNMVPISQAGRVERPTGTQ